MKKNEITPLQTLPTPASEEKHDHGSIRDLQEVEIVRLSEEELEEMHAKARVEAKRRVRVRTAVEKFWIAIGFILALAVAIFALMPIVLTILDSFMSTDEIKTNYSAVYNSLSSAAAETKTYLSSTPKLKMIPDFVSFSQYKTLLFLSPTYLLKFWNSVALVVPIVLGQIMIGCLASYSFARYRKKRREVLFFSYVILMLMPFQVTLVPNYLIANWLGIYNTWWAIILPGVFSTFSIFLLSKYMRQIPSSYIEAAKLDGANEWHIFTKICLPMCKSAIYAMAILLFIDYWNMVEQPLILLEDAGKQPLSVFLSQINASEVGVAFAASFIFMIPPLLIFLYGEQYLVEGISRSGIK
jgi:multiple sugar transport system permease protein